MMSHLKLLLVGVATTLSMPEYHDKPGLVVSVNTDICGPYPVFEPPNRRALFTIKTNQDLHEACEEIRCLNREEDIYIWRTRTDYHSVQANVEYIADLLLPTYDCLDSPGRVFIFDIKEKEEIVFSRRFRIYPNIKETINPLEYNNSTYYLKPRQFQFIDGEPYTYSEHFTFKDFTDYFTFDSYYRLKIDQFRFTYSGNEQITYKEAYLVLPDPQDCYSGLITNSEEEIRIPLKIYKNKNNEFYLKFANKFYVNKQNLLMSINSKDGYVTSDYFYFPFNRKEMVLKQKYLFEIIEFGKNKTSFKWETKLLDVPNLIGDCSNSQFCIVGGVK